MGQVIKTDERGVGKNLFTEPEAAAAQRLRTHEVWEQEWDALSEKFSEAWPENVSPVDVVSGMRR